MKKNTKIISLVIVLVISLLLIFIAFSQLYTNGKTDGFESGNVKVSGCKEDNWAWKIYMCKGEYNSNAGMIETSDVTVRVTGSEYKNGDYIGDVYPGDGASLEDSRYFITGLERSSVAHNIPWIALMFLGILLPFGTAAYVLGSRLRAN